MARRKQLVYWGVNSQVEWRGGGEKSVCEAGIGGYIRENAIKGVGVTVVSFLTIKFHIFGILR